MHDVDTFKQDLEELHITIFDLLGELIKFNKRALTIFEITTGETNLKRLEEKIFQNVVNTNLLIRNIVLTMA